MPDRITKQCHSAYKKACKEYKKAHELVYGESCTIGICEFLEIWGGCAEMNFPGAWFSWCSTQNVLAAWRAVGFFQGALDPTQIDRTNFFDRVHTALAPPEPEPAPEPEPVQELEANLKTPPGMRSKSTAALEHKLKAAMTLVDRLKGDLASPLDPSTVPGLMDPRKPAKPKRARSGTRLQESEGGDASLRGLGASATAKRDAAKAEEERLESMREERAAKKARLEEEKNELDAEFELCFVNRDAEGKCQCGPGCRMAKMIRCSVCKLVKKGKCRVAACQAATPLLLTHNPTPLLTHNA